MSAGPSDEGLTQGIAGTNRQAWTGKSTLRWFARYAGWSDPGEQAATDHVREEMAGKRILDIGVGAGRTVPLLRAISEDYLAVDFTQAMVEICREKFPDVRVEWGDARRLDRYEAGSFDLVVFSWNGIDAVGRADRRKILDEVNRVLSPGGIFLFSAHNEQGPGCGEKPWTLRKQDLKHPKHIADLALFFPLNMWHRFRRRKATVIGDGWSIRNAAAHHFELVIHYTTIENQLDELAAAGYGDVVVFENEEGRMVDRGDDLRSSWWLHFVARKLGRDENEA